MLKVLWGGEIVLSGEEPFNCLSNTKWSALNTYTQATWYRMTSVHLEIICMSQLIEKEAVKLKESKKGYMRGRKEREGNGVIKISKIKFKSIFYLIIPLRFFYFLAWWHQSMYRDSRSYSFLVVSEKIIKNKGFFLTSYHSKIVFVYNCVQAHKCVHVCLYVFVCMYLCKHTCVCMHVCVFVCLQTHTHTDRDRERQRQRGTER